MRVWICTTHETDYSVYHCLTQSLSPIQVSGLLVNLFTTNPFYSVYNYRLYRELLLPFDPLKLFYQMQEAMTHVTLHCLFRHRILLIVSDSPCQDKSLLNDNKFKKYIKAIKIDDKFSAIYILPLKLRSVFLIKIIYHHLERKQLCVLKLV